MSTWLFVGLLFVLWDLVLAGVVPDAEESVAVDRGGTADAVLALDLGQIQL